MSMLDFVDKLAFQFIFGNVQRPNNQMGAPPRRSSDIDPLNPKEIKWPSLRPLYELERYQEKKLQKGKKWRVKLKCKKIKCGNDASYFCSLCFDQNYPKQELVYAFCFPTAGRSCFLEHCFAEHNLNLMQLCFFLQILSLFPPGFRFIKKLFKKL